MTIDIIDLNDPDYENLSSMQYAMIEAAQRQKNQILDRAKQDRDSFFRKLLSNNVVRSSALNGEYDRINAAAEAKIEIVKADLKYQLAYSLQLWNGNENGVYRYPENPNYNLNDSQRFLVVREYYMNVTSNPQARLQAYSMDTLAQSYLGEFYQTLYSLLASYC